jgi:hypothetical protein
MGLIEIQKRLEAKRQLLKDQEGIGPLIAGIILLVVAAGIGITALAVYNITQRPDIIYNITNPGFSLAGLEMDSIWIGVAVIGALILLYLFMKKKK